MRSLIHLTLASVLTMSAANAAPLGFQRQFVQQPLLQDMSVVADSGAYGECQIDDAPMSFAALFTEDGQAIVQISELDEPTGLASAGDILGGVWEWMGTHAECKMKVVLAEQRCMLDGKDPGCCARLAAMYEYTCIWGGSAGPDQTEFSDACPVADDDPGSFGPGSGGDEGNTCEDFEGMTTSLPCQATHSGTGETHECVCDVILTDCTEGTGTSDCDCTAELMGQPECF